jgi:hypothetical protein
VSVKLFIADLAKCKIASELLTEREAPPPFKSGLAAERVCIKKLIWNANSIHNALALIEESHPSF